jgi:hypothetical protein
LFVFVETSNVDRFKSDLVGMARQRPRRPRVSSPSSDNGANPISGAAAQPALLQPAQAAASQDATPSLGNQPSSQPIPVSNFSVSQPLDSALQALADRADELSDPEDELQDEVAEADASGAGQQVAEAHASGAGLRAEVDTSGSGSNQDQPPSTSDCIFVSYTAPSDNASGSKISTASVLTPLDVTLMREKEEMILQKRLDIARRCEKLQAEIASDLQQFLSQNPMYNSSPSSEEFVKFGMLNFWKSGDHSLSSSDQPSSLNEGKTQGPQVPRFRKAEIQFFPQKGLLDLLTALRQGKENNLTKVLTHLILPPSPATTSL